MNNDYIQITIRYESDLDEDVNSLLIHSGMVGAQVIDPNTLLHHKESAPDWELTDEAELRANQLEESENQLLENTIVQNIFFQNDDSGRASMDSLLRSFYEQYGGQVEILREKIIVNDNWEEEWKKFYHPISIGEHIIIVPEWENAPENTEGEIIRINPGMAFGTGSHETTMLCLAALENVNFDNKSMLDLGCGSGILAIYAKKMGADRVDACDIDPTALESCEANLELNNVEVNVYESDLFQAVDGTFDVICANLLAEIVVRMLDEVNGYLTQNGLLFLSGILVEKVPLVLEKLEEESFEMTHMETMGEWAMIEARRKELA